MSTQISNQASKVWNTLTDPETAKTYGQTGKLTWNIIQEVGLLLWLVLCLTLVLFDWFWKNSIRLGSNTRNWIENIEKPSTDRIASETGKTLASAFSNGAAFALAQAREQLGLPQPVEEEAPKPSVSSSAPAASMKAEPTPVKPAVPKVDENAVPSDVLETTEEMDTKP
ncbi:hypothetical protein ACQ4M4_10040 [Leptolyngbya sp. AN02str]|uniref:hypothetical protein n=1 Tax=Leptolyngbya sp. AN02str TaxID=3423363 RepID=UPI003D31201D